MPPNRPPLPTTPKQAPKAGVISIVKTDQQRPVSAGDSSVSPSIPHRPAPPVALAKAYQDTEQQKQNLSRKSSSSSSSSPVEESEQKQSPPAQSLVIHDQDTGAIYEEINDDIVSSVSEIFYMLTNIYEGLTLNIFMLQYIPKPRDPPPPLPQDSVYDLDVNPNKSNTASPSRVAPSPPGRPQPPVPNAMATPPPLPRRQNAAPSAAPSANELPKVPARSGAPPPLPARPNSQM